MTTFDHRDRGTDEAVWEAAGVNRTAGTAGIATPFDLTGFTGLVVVAAHPDDESLMCGGLLALAGAKGMHVEVLVATDGEASHPDSPTHTPERLASLRRHECSSAVAELAPRARLRFLGLGDGRTAEHGDTLTAEVVRAVTGAGAAGCLLVSTWRGDGHPDHRAVALATSAAAWRTDTVHLEAPLWFWHWGRPEDLPALSGDGRAVSLSLDPRARDAKRSAVARHRSQVEPLGPEPGNEALLSASVLRHFSRDVEIFVETPPDRRSAFDGLHRGTPDPWSTRTSWYEQRKRALTLAALPDAHTGTVLEIGCSVGTLAADLAGRCDRVIAVDDSTAALTRARRAVDDPRVSFRQCMVPEQWPAGDAGGPLRPDVVVLSETGYFLSPGRMRALARRIRDSDAGAVLACHWRHPVEGWPLDAADVHAVLAGTLTQPESLRVRDRDFEIVLWRHGADGADGTDGGARR